MKASYLKFILSIILFGIIAAPGFAQADSSKLDLSNLSKPDLEKWGDDSATCVRNYSLYREYYKNYKRSKESGKLDEAKNYMKSAVKPWRWVFNNCPVASQNVYRDGAEIIEYLYNNAEPADKSAYGDTLMMVYDQRLKMYGWKEGVGYILGRKAVDHMKFKRGNEEKTFEIFEKAFDYTKEGNYNAAVLFYHLYSAVNMFKTGKAEKELIVNTYFKISEIFQEKISSQAKGYKAFEQLNPRIKKLFEPFATCADLIKVFSKQFEEKPDDVRLLKRISNMLDSKGCTESDLYFNATKRLHAVEPSAESAYLMGKMAIKRELYDEAAKYLEEAATSFEDSAEINDAYFLLANVNYVQGKLSSARSNAYNALKYKPNDGRCYILIGDLYANSSSVCNLDGKVANKSIYWAAVDKYQKAKSVDPSVAEKAQQKISKFYNFFPSQDEIFFENYSVGQTYTVGCWINETTKVRHK